jgi:hypothetical protein
MELSDAAARELANHVGELILFGVSRLSDVAAGYLSSHNGRVEFHMLNELSSRAARMLMNSGAWVQGGWARFHPDPVL